MAMMEHGSFLNGQLTNINDIKLKESDSEAKLVGTCLPRTYLSLQLEFPTMRFQMLKNIVEVEDVVCILKSKAFI